MNRKDLFIFRIEKERPVLNIFSTLLSDTSSILKAPFYSPLLITIHLLSSPSLSCWRMILHLFAWAVHNFLIFWFVLKASPQTSNIAWSWCFNLGDDFKFHWTRSFQLSRSRVKYQDLVSINLLSTTKSPFATTFQPLESGLNSSPVTCLVFSNRNNSHRPIHLFVVDRFFSI